jgi:hypothetical protein
MPQSQIQSEVDAVYQRQQSNQFGTQRYALLFKPGSYGTAADPLVFEVGYYTEVAGLGASPDDVVINGQVDVFDQCGSGDCNALDNFWRSVSNLRINVAGDPGFGNGCYTDTEMYAVSQAAPMRRVAVHGGAFSLQDYCGDGTFTGSHYASGGFIADSATNDTITNGGQQQWLTRNSSIGGWSNGVWNQVFAGVDGAPAQSFPDPPYTTLATNPVSRERPFLTLDAHGSYSVFVPAAQHDSRGTTWANGPTPGRSVPIRDFFVATPSDGVQRINNALSRGKDLLFTPGVYHLEKTIKLKRTDTVVLGLGFATLEPMHGQVAMSVHDVRGADIAGLIFDAGPANSPVLLQVGKRHGRNHKSSAADPSALQDVFFRVGGPHPGKATVSLRVDSSNVILDDVWAWRADHGAGVGWTKNTARNGVVVTGDHVTATGLFVEHYQKYDVIWDGEHGETIFFQNEMPYDPPNQHAWEHDGKLGYAAYKVGRHVRHHVGYGLGSYIYTNVDPSLHASDAFEVPRTPGVSLHDILTVSLNHAGTIDHVVNDYGAPVTPNYQGPSYVTDYPPAT